MSEYQYIYFAAVDRPLDDKQLASSNERFTGAKSSGLMATIGSHTFATPVDAI